MGGGNLKARMAALAEQQAADAAELERKEKRHSGVKDGAIKQGKTAYIQVAPVTNLTARRPECRRGPFLPPLSPANRCRCPTNVPDASCGQSVQTLPSNETKSGTGQLELPELLARLAAPDAAITDIELSGRRSVRTETAAHHMPPHTAYHPPPHPPTLPRTAAGDKHFCWLTPEKKNESLSKLSAAAATLDTLRLERLEIDDGNAGAIAALLGGLTALRMVSIERNNLKETGLLAIAQVRRGGEEGVS